MFGLAQRQVAKLLQEAVAKHLATAHVVIDDGQPIRALTPAVTGVAVHLRKLQVKGGPVGLHRRANPEPDRVAPASYQPSGPRGRQRAAPSTRPWQVLSHRRIHGRNTESRSVTRACLRSWSPTSSSGRLDR